MLLLIKMPENVGHALIYEFGESPATKQVKTIHDYIRDKRGLPHYEQCLMFQGQELDGGRFLAEYNICDQCAVELVVKSYKIFVQTVMDDCMSKPGDTVEPLLYTLDVYGSDVASAVKEQIQEKSKEIYGPEKMIPVERQCLTFSGETLGDGPNLRSFEIGAESAVSLVIKLERT